MEDKKNQIIEWIKNNKKKLIIAGVSITTILVVCLGLKKHEELEAAFASLKKLVDKTSTPNEDFACDGTTALSIACTCEDIVEIQNDIVPICRTPHDVSEHIRNLHEGYKPSQEKIIEAARKGIPLEDGQTLVDAYRTGINVA